LVVSKNPRLAATAVTNALAVSTKAIFIAGGAPNRRRADINENQPVDATERASLAFLDLLQQILPIQPLKM
jgi:hypothetical protein